jgi:hypothetical protein
MSELLVNQLKETTDQDLPPTFDDMLDLFQRQSEELGIIPVGTPKSYVVRTLKNNLRATDLAKDYAPRRCRAEIIYFRGTENSAKTTPNDDFCNWAPYTDRPLRIYDVPASHAQLLSKPVSYKLIANKVHELMNSLNQKN